MLLQLKHEETLPSLCLFVPIWNIPRLSTDGPPDGSFPIISWLTMNTVFLVPPSFSAAAISLARRNKSSISKFYVVRTPGFFIIIKVRMCAGRASKKFRTKSDFERCEPTMDTESQNSV